MKLMFLSCLLSVASLASAQLSPEEAQQRLAQKRQATTQPSAQEVADLRQIVASLRAENAALKKEVAALKIDNAKGRELLSRRVAEITAPAVAKPNEPVETPDDKTHQLEKSMAQSMLGMRLVTFKAMGETVIPQGDNIYRIIHGDGSTKITVGTDAEGVVILANVNGEIVTKAK